MAVTRRPQRDGRASLHAIRPVRSRCELLAQAGRRGGCAPLKMGNSSPALVTTTPAVAGGQPCPRITAHLLRAQRRGRAARLARRVQARETAPSPRMGRRLAYTDDARLRLANCSLPRTSRSASGLRSQLSSGHDRRKARLHKSYPGCLWRAPARQTYLGAASVSTRLLR